MHSVNHNLFSVRPTAGNFGTCWRVNTTALFCPYMHTLESTLCAPLCNTFWQCCATTHLCPSLLPCFLPVAPTQALLGPSGAGKSTLMDILAQRKSMGNLSGFLLVDGQPATSSFIRKTAYVPQVRQQLNCQAVPAFSCMDPGSSPSAATQRTSMHTGCSMALNVGPP